MRSRRDQLQAYQFLRHRTVSALLSGEPESVESPMRRIVRTSFAGLMVAVIALAVFGVVGLLKKGGANSWRTHDTIVLEKETDASYVWLKGRLYPMQNYTSARLLLGSPVQQSISRRSLAGIPRMAPRGIVGAPHALPDPGDLTRDPWTVCARTVGKRARVTLLIGAQPPPGRLRGDTGALVTSGVPGQPTFLVWRDRALRIPADVPEVTLALGFPTPDARPVGAAWLNALPRGPDLTFPEIPNRGTPVLLLRGFPTRVGRVYVEHSVGRVQYFLMLSDGLAPISRGVAALVLADRRSQSAYPAGPPREVPIAAVAATNARRSRTGIDLSGYPVQPLTPAGGAGQDVLCTSVSGTATGQPTQSVHAVAALNDIARPPDGPPVLVGLPTADAVYLPPGGGAIARDGASSTLFLITGNGTKYPIADSAALAALGYDKVPVSTLPTDFLSLLPTGPTLSRQGAGQPALPMPTPAPSGSGVP